MCSMRSIFNINNNLTIEYALIEYASVCALCVAFSILITIWRFFYTTKSGYCFKSTSSSLVQTFTTTESYMYAFSGTLMPFKVFKPCGSSSSWISLAAWWKVHRSASHNRPPDRNLMHQGLLAWFGSGSFVHWWFRNRIFFISNVVATELAWRQH